MGEFLLALVFIMRENAEEALIVEAHQAPMSVTYMALLQ